MGFCWWVFCGWAFLGGYFVCGYFVGGYFVGWYFDGGYFWTDFWIEKKNKYFVIFDWHFWLQRGAENTEEVFILQKK